MFDTDSSLDASLRYLKLGIWIIHVRMWYTEPASNVSHPSRYKKDRMEALLKILNISHFTNYFEGIHKKDNIKIHGHQKNCFQHV